MAPRRSRAAPTSSTTSPSSRSASGTRARRGSVEVGVVVCHVATALREGIFASPRCPWRYERSARPTQRHGKELRNDERKKRQRPPDCTAQTARRHRPRCSCGPGGQPFGKRGDDGDVQLRRPVGDRRRRRQLDRDQPGRSRKDPRERRGGRGRRRQPDGGQHDADPGLRPGRQRH